jgi:hypothetical protein
MASSSLSVQEDCIWRNGVHQSLLKLYDTNTWRGRRYENKFKQVEGTTT